MNLSVVICSYNPKPVTLNKVLDALKLQTLDKSMWELIIVDNCSTPPLVNVIDLSWHPRAKIIVEGRTGLSHARIAGVKNSITELIVFADDDNVLAPDYLEKSYGFYQSYPQVGCYGGRSLPVFETQPPGWFKQTGINLGCQDYGPELYISDYTAINYRVGSYPEKAPIGTGMVIQKKAFLGYLEEAAIDPERMKLGRSGKSLSSGEDNDIILSIIKNRFEIAYVPELVVHHLISSNRYSESYLARMAFESNRTWVKVLQMHGLNPHKRIAPLTYLPRKWRSYFRHRAWRSSLSAIQWKSSCGTFKGLSEI